MLISSAVMLPLRSSSYLRNTCTSPPSKPIFAGRGENKARRRVAFNNHFTAPRTDPYRVLSPGIDSINSVFRTVSLSFLLLLFLAGLELYPPSFLGGQWSQRFILSAPRLCVGCLSRSGFSILRSSPAFIGLPNRTVK